MKPFFFLHRKMAEFIILPPDFVFPLRKLHSEFPWRFATIQHGNIGYFHDRVLLDLFSSILQVLFENIYPMYYTCSIGKTKKWS